MFQTSEFDSLDWSPATTDNILMGGIDDYFWTSDTLFSTINNTPNLAWPDPREIGMRLIKIRKVENIPVNCDVFCSKSGYCRFYTTQSWSVAAQFRRFHERNTISR